MPRPSSTPTAMKPEAQELVLAAVDGLAELGRGLIAARVVRRRRRRPRGATCAAGFDRWLALNPGLPSASTVPRGAPDAHPVAGDSQFTGSTDFTAPSGPDDDVEAAAALSAEVSTPYCTFPSPSPLHVEALQDGVGQLVAHLGRAPSAGIEVEVVGRRTCRPTPAWPSCDDSSPSTYTHGCASAPSLSATNRFTTRAVALISKYCCGPPSSASSASIAIGDVGHAGRSASAWAVPVGSQMVTPGRGGGPGAVVAAAGDHAAGEHQAHRDRDAAARRDRLVIMRPKATGASSRSGNRARARRVTTHQRHHLRRRRSPAATRPHGRPTRRPRRGTARSGRLTAAPALPDHLDRGGASRPESGACGGDAAACTVDTSADTHATRAAAHPDPHAAHHTVHERNAECRSPCPRLRPPSRRARSSGGAWCAR